MESVCDRVGLVRKGRLITEASITALKKRVVRQLEVTFAHPVSGKEFDLENTDILEQGSHRLVLHVSGNINPVLKKIAEHEVKNLVFPEPSLEETFMTFYEKG